MIPDDFAPLLDAVLEGRADEEQFARFQGLLRADPRLIDAYTDQAHLHALLEWRSGQAGVRRVSNVSRAWIGRVAAAFILAAVGALFPVAAGNGEVATILESSDPALQAGERVSPGLLAVGDGTLKVYFDRGITLTVEGPAEMVVESGMRVSMNRGRATARVEPLGRGFTLETPQARIQDLGTEFGIDVESSGATGVAVFEGIVDVHRGGAPQRLLKGQGVRIEAGKDVERLVSIERDHDRWSPRPQLGGVIDGVRDNLRGTRCFYQVVRGGLTEDAAAFVDRTHEWNGMDEIGIPIEILGADYVMPFMDDKRAEGLEMTVLLSQPADLFVLWDDRVPPADWLKADFEDTRLDIGLDEGPSGGARLAYTTERGAGKSVDTRFSVWRCRQVVAGEVRLGSLGMNAARFSMYGVAAKAVE